MPISEDDAPGPLDVFLVRYNGIRTVSLTCDCTWTSKWSALPVHLTTLVALARGHLRDSHGMDTRPKSPGGAS